MLLEIEVMVICIICATIVLVSLINAITDVIAVNKFMDAINKTLFNIGTMFKDEL